MKITKEKIKKTLFPFIENNKLEELLNKKWWHRLIVVLFSLIVITGTIAVIVLSVILFLETDQDLNFLSGISFCLSTALILYIFILLIQFIYFHIFLYIIYGDNSNILINLKTIFRNIVFSIIFLASLGAIIYFTANISCDKDRMFYSVQELSFICECNAGYREDSYGCFKANIPENAHKCKSDSGWCCDFGYTEKNNECIDYFKLKK